MPAQVDPEQCNGCGDCIAGCPVNGVLVMNGDKAVVSTPDECIECNACADACSSGAMTIAG